MHTTTQPGGQAMLASDPHYDEKQAFSSLFVFTDLTGDHVQVQPVSRCHLTRPAPPTKPPKPAGLVRKDREYVLPGERQIEALTSGCPVDLAGFPVEDPQAFRQDPTFQPQPTSAGSTQASPSKKARFQVQITFGGKL
jgi:hypothetical protein